MTERESPPGRARLVDLLRPGLLYEKLRHTPSFVLPTLALVFCGALYSQLAVGPAIPRVIPALLERSAATWAAEQFPTGSATDAAWSATRLVAAGAMGRAMSAADLAHRLSLPRLPDRALPASLRHALYPLPEGNEVR